MNKIDLNLNSVKALAGKVTQNLSWLFFLAFLLVLLLEIFVVKTSIQLALKAGQAPQPVIANSKKLRINFENYNAVADRIKQAANFKPSGGLTKNPFQIPE